MPKPAPERGGVRWRRGALAVAVLAVASGGTAHAQLKLTPTLRSEVTYTNNVKLDTDEARQSDFVFTIAPGLGIDYRAPRAVLRGFVEVPAFLYARTGDEDRVLPRVELTGNLEVVPEFFFVDGSISVSEAYFSPFGARPSSPVNPTVNEYRLQSYRVSPYIQGWLGGTVRYSLRDDNLWTRTSGQAVGDGDSYTNRLTGSLVRDPTPLGWTVEIDRADYQFESRERSQTLALARALVTWQASPAWRLYVSGGYEDNEFPLTRSEGAIYGAGFGWRPTERTRLDVGWEERFFGASYRVAFEHRIPLAIFNVSASRNISSYPENVATLPAGAFVPGLLNQILVGRIPDPLERAQFIANFMAQNGLPLTLEDSFAIYNQQVYLEERAFGSVALLGVRNTVLLSVWRTKTQPIAGNGEIIPPQLFALSNNTQVGSGASWSYRVSPSTSSTLSMFWSRTEANEPFDESSTQRNARFTLTHTVSPRTTVFGGVGWQDRKGLNARDNYDEASIFAGFSYRGL